MNMRSNNDDAAEDFAESGGFFERMGRVWQRRWVRIPAVLAVIGGLVGGGLWAVGKVERRQSRKLTEIPITSKRARPRRREWGSKRL